jgi:hypothetical protein
LKQTGIQLDDRIVEAVWNGAAQNWDILQIRDDKTTPNSLATAITAQLTLEAGVGLPEVGYSLFQHEFR